MTPLRDVKSQAYPRPVLIVSKLPMLLIGCTEHPHVHISFPHFVAMIGVSHWCKLDIATISYCMVVLSINTQGKIRECRTTRGVRHRAHVNEVLGIPHDKYYTGAKRSYSNFSFDFSANNSGAFYRLTCTRMLVTISMFTMHEMIAGIGPLDRA